MNRVALVLLIIAVLFVATVNSRAQMMLFGYGPGGSTGVAGPGCTANGLDFTDGCGTILVPALIH